MLTIHKCNQVTQKPVPQGFPVRFRVSLPMFHNQIVINKKNLCQRNLTKDFYFENFLNLKLVMIKQRQARLHYYWKLATYLIQQKNLIY